MSTHNIHFCGEIRKILCEYPLLSGVMNLYLYSPLHFFYAYIAILICFFYSGKKRE